MGYVGDHLEPLCSDDGRVNAAMVDMAVDGGDRLHDVVVRNTPRDTGELRDSWYTTPPSRVRRPPLSGWEVTVATEVDYAPHVEWGTGLWGPKHAKYPILPKRPGGWLRWKDGETGQWVFAKKVMHPGSPGQHMMAIGVAVCEYEFESICQPTLSAWARAQEAASE